MCFKFGKNFFLLLVYWNFFFVSLGSLKKKKKKKHKKLPFEFSVLFWLLTPHLLCQNFLMHYLFQTIFILINWNFLSFWISVVITPLGPDFTLLTSEWPKLSGVSGHSACNSVKKKKSLLNIYVKNLVLSNWMRSRFWVAKVFYTVFWAHNIRNILLEQKKIFFIACVTFHSTSNSAKVLTRVMC